MPNLTEIHRLAQSRIAARTLFQMREVWPLLDREALDATTARWLIAAVPIIANQREASARLAAGYLTAHKLETLGGTIDLELATDLDPRAVATSLVVTGPVALKRAARTGVPHATALDRALGTSSAAAMRHALNGGRQTILQTVASDPDADGWRRITSGHSCDFCDELAGRGAIYREATAGFRAHDGCSCSAEPVWAA